MLNNIPFYVYNSFIHSSVDRHLGCFHVLVTENNATMYTGVRTPLQAPAFNYFAYIPESKINGSYGNF